MTTINYYSATLIGPCPFSTGSKIGLLNCVEHWYVISYPLRDLDLVKKPTHSSSTHRHMIHGSAPIRSISRVRRRLEHLVYGYLRTGREGWYYCQTYRVWFKFELNDMIHFFSVTISVISIMNLRFQKTKHILSIFLRLNF